MRYSIDALDRQLSELLKGKECETVEFKSALDGFPKSFWETYSAFANTQGGIIILGVKEYHNEFELNDLSDADISRPADGRILKNYSWDDIDRPSLEQYRRLFAVAKPSHPWLTLSDEELMRKLGGYRKDRETGEEGFTVAGLLMFGKYDSIRDESCVPRFFPDYKEIPVNMTEQRWIDRVYPDGTWEVNLFQFYRRVLPKLQEVIPTPFRLENSQRIDETLAHESLREALANLCIHADYSEESSLLVYRYPHYLLFSNPGTMLVTPMQFYYGGESVCRNTNFQTMFMMLGSADKASSGGDKILKGWDSIGWMKPYISEKSQPNKVELLMPLESLMDERVLHELQRRFGDKFAGLNKYERMVLALSLTENKVNHERLRYVLPLHPADITHVLQHLTRLGMLVSNGYGRGTTYQLNVCPEGETLQVERETLQVERETLQAEGETLQAKRETLQAERETLQAEREKSVAVPRRMLHDEMVKRIVTFCTEWRTAEEIAVFLHRSKRYITNEVLPKMDNQLDRLYPQVRRHPAQKYRSKKEK